MSDSNTLIIKFLMVLIAHKHATRLQYLDILDILVKSVCYYYYYYYYYDIIVSLI
jgi:hypothetical protein